MEIFTSEFRFDRKNSNVNAVRSVTKDQLVEFSKKIFNREHAVVEWIYGKSSNNTIDESYKKFIEIGNNS